MQNTAISIENLSVRFRGYTVLDGISASIPAGGCTVFVGPNGAGKTTLLLCLLGEVPYTGTIRKSGDFAGRVGYVPQDLRRADSTPVTVSEFLALSVSRRPMWLGFGGAVRRAVSDVLAEVDMRDAAERRICDLSGGQLRRVLLAQALIRRPRLLLLDEPAAGVDLRGEHLFWDILDDARRRLGLTTVMVSHNLPMAAHFATHVVCIFDGTCMEGAPHKVLTARNLMEVFGIPIHLYPDQCSQPQYLCPKCGAFSREEDGNAGSAPTCCSLNPEGSPFRAACSCGRAGENKHD